MSDVEKGVPTSNAFEAELGRQVLASERERAGLLVLMGLGIFVTLGVVNLIQTARGQPLPAFKWALIVTIAATAYEWMIRQLFDRYLREGRELPGFIRYMTVALETSVPTLILVAFVYTMNVDTAMTSAAILTYFFFIILSALSLDVRLSVFAGIVAALGYVALILIYRDQLPLGAIEPPELKVGYLLRPIFLLFGGIIAGLVAARVRSGILRSLHAAEERRRIVQMFGQHVSPAVVNQLLAQPTGIQSELRDVCILVLDIRGFTAFAEKATPDAIVNYLNGLWSKAVEIVNRHHGIVNKFLGDGFMAVFGAPVVIGNHCQNAINAARELVADIKRATDAGEIPPTQIGIGLHSGEALVGNIGSAERREYTVIGDVVNVAFRIEQLNKDLKSSFLVSESVQEAAGKVDGVESSASVPIRGRNAPIRIYRLG